MGDEAGQKLRTILARKEAERALGKGIFFWGIGASLGRKIWDFVDFVEKPMVLFSPMLAKPKFIDTNPDRIFCWTAYLDRWGNKHPMPYSSLVTSRATASGKVKQTHYALVCRKTTPLTEDFLPPLHRSNLRNFHSGSNLGFSQVTALVESENPADSSDYSHEVLFSAELADPHYATLVDPAEIPEEIWAAANARWENGGFSAADWQAWIVTNKPKFCKILSDFGVIRNLSLFDSEETRYEHF